MPFFKKQQNHNKLKMRIHAQKYTCLISTLVSICNYLSFRYSQKKTNSQTTHYSLFEQRSWIFLLLLLFYQPTLFIFRLTHSAHNFQWQNTAQPFHTNSHHWLKMNKNSSLLIVVNSHIYPFNNTPILTPTMVYFGA